MAIAFGDNGVSKAYVGTQQVQRAYMGTALVYSAATPTPSPSPSPTPTPTATVDPTVYIQVSQSSNMAVTQPNGRQLDILVNASTIDLASVYTIGEYLFAGTASWNIEENWQPSITGSISINGSVVQTIPGGQRIAYQGSQIIASGSKIQIGFSTATSAVIQTTALLTGSYFRLDA